MSRGKYDQRTPKLTVECARPTCHHLNGRHEGKLNDGSCSVSACDCPRFVVPFSAAEMKVLLLLAKGRNMKQIAVALALSYKTIDAHQRNMRRKIGAHSQLELILFSWNDGVISMREPPIEVLRNPARKRDSIAIH